MSYILLSQKRQISERSGEEVPRKRNFQGISQKYWEIYPQKGKTTVCINFISSLCDTYNKETIRQTTILAAGK
jgi:hypothetical protein